MSSAAVIYPHLTAASIQQELEEAERALAAAEHDDNHDNHPNDDDEVTSVLLSPYAQLQRLDQTANDLLLAKDVAAWMKRYETSNDDNDDDDDDDEPSFVHQAQRCVALGELLRQHEVPTTIPSSSNNNINSSMYHTLYQEEFVPTAEYLESMLAYQLRQTLRQVGYPSPPACEQLMDECEQQADDPESSSSSSSSFSHVSTTADWLHRVRIQHDQVTAHVLGRSSVATTTTRSTTLLDPVVVELCRPLTERVRHFFVVQLQQELQQPRQNSNTAAIRLERLPEWLFAYLRQHVFPQDTDGPWDVIHYGWQPRQRWDLSIDFLNEIIRLCQWVFEQHDLFGKRQVLQQPMHLCQAIEQLLKFDNFIATTVLGGNTHAKRVLSLMDIYVAGDDELLEWWMDREREAIFDSLFHGTILDQNSTATALPGQIIYPAVAPRAELFCSLLRSVRTKAAAFSFSAPYLQRVAAPLCLQFLDAVHDSATELKGNLLQQRRGSTTITAAALQQNVGEWCQLINGTHASARLLLGGEDGYDDDDDGDFDVQEGAVWEQDNDPAAAADNNQEPPMGRSSAHHDMQRFGQSLERLETVFIEEFASCFVETLLLERTKMANFLMMGSHVLSSYEDDEHDSSNKSVMPDLSPDLADAQHLLESFLSVVDEPPLPSMPASLRNTTFYAPRALRSQTLTLVAEKFLEVALDWHGTTPEIWPQGARRFAVNVSLLLGDDSLLPEAAMRLLDVNTCMCMDAVQLSSLGDVLCGLAGQPPPLSEDMFAVDDKIYDEAVSMIRAKNLLWLSLGDFLSILNRRPDLSHIGAF